MSDENVETRDPDAVRVFALRETEDGESAYCERHDRELWAVDPVVHHDGALYSTGEAFSVHTCPGCIAELDRLSEDGDAGRELFHKSLASAFDAWAVAGATDGDGDGGWFRFIRDAEPEDVDGDDAAFAVDEVGSDEDRGGEA